MFSNYILLGYFNMRKSKFVYILWIINDIFTAFKKSSWVQQ